MAFEGLTQRLQDAFAKLTARGKLTEKDVREAMREVRVALLEADVNFLVVKDFIKKVTDRAVGEEILASLTPGQAVISIVNEELTALMGGQQARLNYAPNPPTIIMLCGLQGSGKTTMSAKLGGYFKKQGKKPLLVACDIYRPAAIHQLQVVGGQVDVPVFEKGTQNPVITAQEAVEHAKYYGNDPVILDTAGRLHIDEELMDELKNIKSTVHPNEIMLVVDAMTGQDAVNVSKSFDDLLDITGVVLTKLDGDTRGGAAMSVKAVTGKPIKFAGVGEKLADIEPFYPDRMASRILGMGDVLSLIEKAQETFDEHEAKKLEKKMRESTFTLEDFLQQFQQIKKMGPLKDLLGMIPGMSSLQDVDIDERQISRTEAIIYSMTPEERNNPEVLNASRRKRIARGSGTTVQDVNRLVRQFMQSREIMKQVMADGKGRRGKKRRMRMAAMAQYNKND